MTHSYRSHFYHLVWSTKNRETFITSDIKSDLYKYIGGIIRSHKGHLLNIGGVEDHVHLLISSILPDKFSTIIRDIKSKSSLWVHNSFPQYPFFAWQEGYSSFTVSYSALNKVIHYINNQAEHHRVISFESEYLKLLEKHKIKYDKRFILG